jgi:hypothetical protein
MTVDLHLSQCSRAMPALKWLGLITRVCLYIYIYIYIYIRYVLFVRARAGLPYTFNLVNTEYLKLIQNIVGIWQQIIMLILKSYFQETHLCL